MSDIHWFALVSTAVAAIAIALGTMFPAMAMGRAIAQALGMAGPNDTVILCGKGHEQSMCFGTVEHPWDDRVAARQALAALGYDGS